MTPWTVHGVLQSRILEWVACPFSRTSSQPRNQTRVSALQADSLLTELSGKPPVVWLWLRSNCGGVNGGDDDLLQKDLCQHASAPRPVAFSAPDPVAGHCRAMLPLETSGRSQASLAQSPVGSLLLPSGSWWAQGLFVPSESLFPVLWKFGNQIPLASKVRFPGESQSLCRIPRLGSLLWALELS